MLYLHTNITNKSVEGRQSAYGVTGNNSGISFHSYLLQFEYYLLINVKSYNPIAFAKYYDQYL